MKYRTERDSLGEVKVPAEHYWGAQSQRSLEHFAVGKEKMPMPVIRALARIKKAAAAVNCRAGKLSEEKSRLIGKACDQIIAGALDDEFPLSLWQTGSGTQSNMNVNEVIANYVNLNRGEKLLHPNDDVNMGQSSNDVFPSACSMASREIIEEALLPETKALAEVFRRKSEDYKSLVKIGRTHLQDATPLTLGQEISAWAEMLETNCRQIEEAAKGFSYLAIGGTAVGTGVNTFEGFGEAVASELSTETRRYYAAENRFYALTARDVPVFCHGAMTALAANLMKIANDIRFSAMGPRAGLAELILPANEPGSSIMPGKVNPTQCEQLTMGAVRVMGNQTVMDVAASQGNFQLNVFAPLLIGSFLQSAEVLSSGMRMFRLYCAEGLKANEAKIKEHLDSSLMLVTALSPHIGYMKAAELAGIAYEEGLSIKEAVLRETDLSEEEADKYLDPAAMIHPERREPEEK